MNPYANFSVMSYSFHGLLGKGAINIFGYLETVKYRYGLNTADIWNGLITAYDEDYINILKQNIEERGLAVVNLCCDGAHIWDNDTDIRAGNEDMAWKCLNLAEKIGARTIRIDAGIREDVFSAEQTDYVAKKYREYCRRAAGFGAKLGTENHWGGTRLVANIEKLFDAVNEPNFGLLLHLGNWAGGDRDANDRAVIGRAMHTHIDFEHCVDAERVLPPLNAAGYTGCWSVEGHRAANEYNDAAFQLAQVKRVICPLNYG
jgi:sugar phosphate isomerase/epimerase